MYSEELHIDLNPQGGEAPYQIGITTSPENPRITLTDHRISFKPGYSDGAGYHPEVGTYNVTATVKDSNGRVSSETFAIEVLPIEWKSVVLKSSASSDMIVEFTINEKLHPSRTYEHNAVIAGQNLNSQVCRNMADPSQSFSMDSAPSVTAHGSSPAAVGTDHKMRLSMSYPFASQPLDNMMSTLMRVAETPIFRTPLVKKKS